MNFQTNGEQKVALTVKRHRRSQQTHRSGKPRSVALKKMLIRLNDLVLSQEDNTDTPRTHRTVCEISHETGIRLRCYEIITMSSVAFY